jgi:peptidyl-prolyl cis-trans isomerase SurA
MSLNRSLIFSLIFLCLYAFSESKAQANFLLAAKIQVNNSVITQFELDQRAKFLGALKFTGNHSELAQTQLIEERLKQSEAQKLNISATDFEIEDALKRFASRANLTVKEFNKELKRLEIYPDTFRSYVETEVIWQKLVNKKFGAQSSVSNLQLQRAKSISKFEDTIQVLLTEIIIPFSKDDRSEKENLANLLKQIKSTEEFSNAAQKYSKAPTAAVGGRVKWQNFDRLPGIIKPLILGLSPGQVTEPIMLTKAIALFQLRDIREIKTDRTQLELLDFIKVKSDLKYLSFVQDNFHNCSDLEAIIGGQTEVTLTRKKLLSNEIPNTLVPVLDNLDQNESEIIVADGQSQLVIMCERNNQLNSTAQTLEQDKNVLQTNRLKHLARSFLETLKDNARIVIK